MRLSLLVGLSLLLLAPPRVPAQTFEITVRVSDVTDIRRNASADLHLILDRVSASPSRRASQADTSPAKKNGS